MLNNISLMGRFTADPVLRYTQSNTPVATFTLAVDRDFTNKDSGDRLTDFIDCVAWRGTAERISKYFTKGQLATVIGRLQIRNWEDADGHKRRNAEIVVENIYFTGPKKTDDRYARGVDAQADAPRYQSSGSEREAVQRRFHEYEDEYYPDAYDRDVEDALNGKYAY